jgi:hypothetical protein
MKRRESATSRSPETAHREAAAGILGRIIVITLLSCAMGIYWFIR